MKKLGLSWKSVIKAAVYGALLIVLYVLQSMIFPRLSIFGIKPLILPVAVMCVSLFEGPIRGGIFGIFAGILCDLSFNQTVMQFTIFMTILGITAGYLFDTVLSTGFPSFLMCTGISLLICAAVQAFGIVFYNGAEILTVLIVAVGQMLYSLVFTFPLYYLVRAVRRISRND